MKFFNKKSIIVYLGILAFSCIILWGFLSGHYATDTYKISGFGYEKYAIEYWLKDGRIIMALVGLLSNIVNVPINIFVIVLSFLGIAISSFIVILLYKIILKYKPSDNKFVKFLLLIISYITIFNFMYIENLYFVDIFAMSISILVYILAAHILCEKNKYYFIKALFLVLIGIFAYQATISVFIVFVLLFTILKNVTSIEIDKKIIKDILEMIIILIISVMLNLVFVKVISTMCNIPQTRISGIENILKNIGIILCGGMLTTLLNTCGLYPKGLLLLFLFITISIFAFYIYNRKKNESYKNTWIILFVLLSILSAFAINLLSVSAFFSGRMRFVIGALIGLIYIYMYVKTDIFIEKNFYKRILISVLIFYFIVGNLVYINNINLHKENNIIEKNEVAVLDEYIKKYEEENNIEVKYLACVLDKENRGKAYSNTKHQMVLTYNALKCDWSAKETINFYTGRNLLRVYEKFDEEIYNTFVNSGLEYMCIYDILYVKIYAR